MNWIEQACSNFWEQKSGRLRVLMNNACENFLRKEPDVERFTLDTIEFQRVRPKIMAEAESFAAELALRGTISRPMMNTLTEKITREIEQELPRLRNETVAEFREREAPINAAGRLRRT